MSTKIRLSTNTWETLAEIQKRTGARGNDVINHVRKAEAAGVVVSRYDEQDGVKVAEWRLKEVTEYV